MIRASLFVEPSRRNKILEYLSHNQKQEPSNICPKCSSTNIVEDLCMNCDLEISFVAEEVAYRDG